MKLLLAFLVLSASSFASPTDMSPLTAQWLSDLSFGVGIQGDPPLIVDPGNGENGANGSFLVKGHPHSSFQILLPSNPVSLLHPSGAALTLGSFRSNPASAAKLDALGSQRVFVGATRGAIPPSLPRGKYRGAFLVTLVY